MRQHGMSLPFGLVWGEACGRSEGWRPCNLQDSKFYSKSSVVRQALSKGRRTGVLSACHTMPCCMGWMGDGLVQV